MRILTRVGQEREKTGQNLGKKGRFEVILWRF
jgi:hypothetical protein